MPRTTKADLERENQELRSKLEDVYDDLADFLDVDDDPDEIDGDDEEE